MENALIPLNRDGQLAPLGNSVRQYLAASVAANTQRGYQSDWKQFTAWCDATGHASLPAAPVMIARYLAHLADNGRKASTIDRARAAIRKMHEAAGLEDPTHALAVTQTLKGIRRTIGTAPQQKAPAVSADIKAMIAHLPDTRKGQRDKALLLVGFAGGFRRSELVGIRAEHVSVTSDGVTILLPFSKTDQEGHGRLVGIRRTAHPETCPVRALLAWLTAAGITCGPVFRSIDKGNHIHPDALTAQSVALVVKAAATAAQLDVAKYSGHSLRAGLVTQAAKNKANVTDIMRQTGHQSVETVNKYIRKANIFEDNVSGMIGL